MEARTPAVKSTEKYLPQFKQKVLDFISKSDTDTGRKPKVTIATAAKKFAVHPTTISDWIQDLKRQKQIDLLNEPVDIGQDTQESSSFQSVGSNVFIRVEHEVIGWLRCQRTGGIPIHLQSVAISTTIQDILNRFKDELARDSDAKSKLQWLVWWAQKLDEGNDVVEFCRQLTGIDFLPLRISSRIAYPASLKGEMVEYAKILGQRKAARLLGVSQKRIHEWLQNDPSKKSTKKTDPLASICTAGQVTTADLRNLPESTSVSNQLSSKSTSQLMDLEIERSLFNWANVTMPTPSSTEIRNKASEMYRNKGHQSMKCSYGWYRRWCLRFKWKTNPHEDSDSIILSWLLQQYDNNELVSYSDLRSFAQTELPKLRSDFKASLGWATRFLKRHHLVFNWDGIMSEELPQGLQLQVDEFIGRICSMNMKRNHVGCMDEVPLTFAGSRSAEPVKTLSRLKKISVKNCDATVILSMRADGFLLPPMVVVKAQNPSNLDQVYTIADNPVTVFYSKTTEPSVTCLEKWLELVWLKIYPEESFLLWDSYDVHCQMQKKCEEMKVNSIQFPSGCASKLQPVNYYFRLEFLKLIDIKWEDYLKKSSANAEIPLPSPNEIVEWVADAYNQMTAQSSVKLHESFEKVGLILNPDD